MEAQGRYEIFTIGHSTHSLDDFIAMLQSFDIQILIDVRRFPFSRKYPWFNQVNLEPELKKRGIDYTHIEELGGRRKIHADSKNMRWRNASFRAYADYMETEEFEQAISRLQDIALKQRSAYMCSEAVWWRCHRSMISDYLKAKGWLVRHIMAIGKADEHPYTSPASVMDGHVNYSDEGLSDN